MEERGDNNLKSQEKKAKGVFFDRKVSPVDKLGLQQQLILIINTFYFSSDSNYLVKKRSEISRKFPSLLVLTKLACLKRLSCQSISWKPNVHLKSRNTSILCIFGCKLISRLSKLLLIQLAGNCRHQSIQLNYRDTHLLHQYPPSHSRTPPGWSDTWTRLLAECPANGPALLPAAPPRGSWRNINHISLHCPVPKIADSQDARHRTETKMFCIWWQGHHLFAHHLTRDGWEISHNSLSRPQPPLLLSTNTCSSSKTIQLLLRPPTVKHAGHVILTSSWIKTALQSLHILYLVSTSISQIIIIVIKARKRFYSQWGGCWYFGASVTALCLIRSGWFGRGCYLKTECWATFQPTPSAVA